MDVFLISFGIVFVSMLILKGLLHVITFDFLLGIDDFIPKYMQPVFISDVHEVLEVLSTFGDSFLHHDFVYAKPEALTALMVVGASNKRKFDLTGLFAQLCHYALGVNKRSNCYLTGQQCLQ